MKFIIIDDIKNYLKFLFSNAIGSNVFDIDLGLGLPFLIFTLVRDQPVSLLSISEWVRKIYH